jgi:hypothetical protein
VPALRWSARAARSGGHWRRRRRRWRPRRLWLAAARQRWTRSWRPSTCTAAPSCRQLPGRCWAATMPRCRRRPARWAPYRRRRPAWPMRAPCCSVRLLRRSASRTASPPRRRSSSQASSSLSSFRWHLLAPWTRQCSRSCCGPRPAPPRRPTSRPPPQLRRTASRATAASSAGQPTARPACALPACWPRQQLPGSCCRCWATAATWRARARRARRPLRRPCRGSWRGWRL